MGQSGEGVRREGRLARRLHAANNLLLTGKLMTRISLIEEKDHPELREFIARIRGDRGGRLLNIYETLLHSPALAMAFLEQVSAVRWKSTPRFPGGCRTPDPMLVTDFSVTKYRASG